MDSKQDSELTSSKLVELVTDDEIKDALKEIEKEIITIREEGLGNGPGTSRWYGIDRLSSISLICENILNHK